MTYNAFGGTLNFTQSINPESLQKNFGGMSGLPTSRCHTNSVTVFP